MLLSDQTAAFVYCELTQCLTSITLAQQCPTPRWLTTQCPAVVFVHPAYMRTISFCPRTAQAEKIHKPKRIQDIDSIEAKIAVYSHQYSTHSITQTWLVEAANSKANGPASSGLPIADDKTSSTMSKQDQH